MVVGMDNLCLDLARIPFCTWFPSPLGADLLAPLTCRQEKFEILMPGGCLAKLFSLQVMIAGLIPVTVVICYSFREF